MIIGEQRVWLFKRGRTGVWYVEYVNDEGQRKQISTKCTTKSEAIVKLSNFKEMIIERKKGILLSEFEDKVIQILKLRRVKLALCQ